jgi:queuine tRNA-ribosyltransferase
MREIRQSTLEGKFLELYHAKRAFLQEDDLDNPVLSPKRKPSKRLVLGDYEVHTAREGFASILHRSSGEIMHSRTPPMEEAQQLYVDQSHLANRLWENDATAEAHPLVLWDVGLGAAANAMAAIRCYEAQVDHFLTTDGSIRLRPLHIVSFENDLDSLRLAFANNDRFAYLRHSAPHGILKDGHWQSRAHAGLTWQLIEGDFLEMMSSAPEPPEVIFYDMFSSKTSGEAWTLEAFQKLFAACLGRPAELFTYTVATSSRVALLHAGFHVARGRSTGPKHETTIAVTPAALAPSTGRERDFLDSAWLAKWERSRAKIPAEIPLDQHAAFEQIIRSHPQFRI